MDGNHVATGFRLGHWIIWPQRDRIDDRGETIRITPKSMAVLQRIRYASPDRVPKAVFKAAAQRGYYIARQPVLMEGRFELIHYVQNQSICDSYHRYGNLGERAELQ